MPVSQSRTVAIGAPSASPLGRPYRWRSKRQDEALDYSVDVSRVMSETFDVMTMVMASITPSGNGALRVDDLTANGNIITARLSGGAAGQAYIVRLQAQTKGTGRVTGAEIVLQVLDPTGNPGAGPGSSPQWNQVTDSSDAPVLDSFGNIVTFAFGTWLERVLIDNDARTITDSTGLPISAN